jgi:hypothetical protein
MIRITRFSALTSTTLAAACWIGTLGCAAANDPTGPGGTGGSGTTSNTVSSTANTVASTAVAANSTVAASTATAAGTGGSTAVSSSAADTTAATTTAGAGGGGEMFTPLCAGLTTAAAAAPTKGGACTATDPQLCYKTCGPQSIGFKSETCMGALYAEQSGCTFPSTGDYTCYKVPAAIDATCPTVAPKASDPCTVAQCTLCNVGGQYLDTSGASKPGYCVCPAPGASGTSKWSCASTTSWPCPGLQGC